MVITKMTSKEKMKEECLSNRVKIKTKCSNSFINSQRVLNLLNYCESKLIANRRIKFVFCLDHFQSEDFKTRYICF